MKALFSRTYVVATLCFPAMSCLCLFMIYGYNTWLPEIMGRAGYSAGSALGFLLMFNFGAVVGQLLLSPVADRLGSKPIIVTTCLLAGAAVVLLRLRLPTAVLYAAVALGVSERWERRRSSWPTSPRTTRSDGCHGDGPGAGFRPHRLDARPSAARTHHRGRTGTSGTSTPSPYPASSAPH
ncbi:hypothetical protein [Streptomyces iakyrus]|uniref:hypothetical protein n=1 Tax=Streptomyces iakyrus TaxID=68219 RepID=UPI003D8FC80A